MTHQATVDWCTLFLRVIGKIPPASSMLEDLDERELNHWWKAKKCSYANLNRLFVRYVHGKLSFENEGNLTNGT